MTEVAIVAGCAVAGLVVGWLLEPVVVRVPRKVPVLGPPTVDVPVPSSIAWRVALAVVCGVLFGATGARFDDSWALPAYLVLAGALVALSAIDLEHYLLPNRIVYPLTGAMVALLGLASLGDDDLDAFVRGLMAGAVVFMVFLALHVISPRSMGFGDVKLSFTLGLALGWLGWGEVFLGVFAAFVYGAVVGLALMLFFRRGRKQAVPFGPFLAAGTLTAVLLGPAIIAWYTAG